jgi:hypothetical protein
MPLVALWNLYLSHEMADQPWHELPPGIADVLRPVLDETAGEMIDAVRTVPAYARPLEGPLGAGIRAGVQEALRHFLAEIEAGGPVAHSEVYSALGRGEMRAGRTLEALLSAYRVGARVAWRRFAAAGVDAGLEPETLYLLAESIFAYIDVLSAQSAEGHALEQSAAASEAQLRRPPHPPPPPGSCGCSRASPLRRPPPSRPRRRRRGGRCRGQLPPSRSPATGEAPRFRCYHRRRSRRRSAS